MIEKYGYNDWYSWSLANWGTKWNIEPEDVTVEASIDCFAVVEFDTAWSSPLKAMIAIAKKFQVNIEMTSIEEVSYSASKYLIGSDGSLFTVAEAGSFYNKDSFEDWKEILGNETLIDYLYDIEEQMGLEESIVDKMVNEGNKSLKEIYNKVIDIFTESF